MYNRLIKWEFIERTLRTIEFLVVIFGVCFSVFQINAILSEQNSKENGLVLQFEDRLLTGTNKLISIAIEQHRPLLKSGKFSTDDIDNYLGTIQDIDSAYDKGLLSDEAVYENFSDSILKAYSNPEIKEYLGFIRKQDQSYFQGFDDIANIEISYSKRDE